MLLVLGGMAAGVLWAGYGGLVASEPEPTPPVSVTVVEARLQDHFLRTRSVAGRVEAARRSRAGFELAGTVVEVRADEGDRVDQGDLLARLDTARLEAERAELEATLADADAEAWLANREFERRSVAGAPAFPQAAVDEARAARDRAEARVAATQARIGRVDVDLGKSRLTAPFDGVVTERRVDEGDVVPAGTPALVLLERTAPEARIGLAGAALGRLEPEQAVSVSIGGRSFDARVRGVVPSRDLSARTVDALLTLDAGWEQVNAGDLARLTLEEEIRAAGAWLPISALTESVRGLFAVYVAVDTSDGASAFRLERREVEVLHQTAERAFVRGGLAEGSLVVTRGLHKLVPNLPVRLSRAAEPGAAKGG